MEEEKLLDFSARTILGNGLSWSAAYFGHDWARHFNFCFKITIFQGSQPIRQFPVEIDDLRYGDPSCKFTSEEVRQQVFEALHVLALSGESNTSAIF